MKKDFIKGVAAGCALSAVLGGAAVFADAMSTQIEAVYNNIKLVVNGEKITPKDANGNTVEPFISGGTTYLPVRAIANALGQEVDWDGDTNTVYIGSKKMGSKIDMSTIKVYDGRSFFTGKDAVFDLKQTKVTPDNRLAGTADRRASLFIINNEYTALEGLFAISDNGSAEGAVQITNSDTGEVLAVVSNKKGEDAVAVKADLTGVKQLRIRFGVMDAAGEFSSNYSGFPEGAFLYNVYLTPAK